MEEYERDPCPYRIIDDCGGAFALGAVGGGIFHSISGAYNAPKRKRFLGAISKVTSKAPLTARAFGAWGGLFSTVDCSLVYVRGKEDPWNSIMSGAATGFLLAGGGASQRIMSGIIGGVLLGMIEGVGILMNKMAGQQAYFENDSNRMLFEDPNAKITQPETSIVESLGQLFNSNKATQ